MQADSGAGLTAQDRACQAYADRMGWSVAGVYQDAGVSGSTGLDRRPGLMAATGELARGAILLVAKRDRLGRDPIKVAMIESYVKRKGARCVSAAGEGTEDDDPTNVLMRRMVDAFAEYERLIIAARTKAAMAVVRSRGQRVGDVPYGFRLAEDGRSLEVDESEQAAVALVMAANREGFSLREIGRMLDEQECEPRGKAWHANTVKRIVDFEDLRSTIKVA
jgi:DNA invertase Pin-like site-specific DNA recombinase